MHENRETSRSAMSERMRTSSPAGEGQGRTTRAYDLEGSDSAVVPMKSPNKVRKPFAAPSRNTELRPVTAALRRRHVGRTCTKRRNPAGPVHGAHAAADSPASSEII